MSSKQDHNDIKWKYEGNKQQYDFNCDVHEGIKQCMWAIENQKSDYAKEVLSEVAKKIHTRNKHIRIAETSEGGWETVKQYEQNPLASDSDDESRINRADSKALKKKKVKQAKLKKKPAVLYGHSDALHQLLEGQAGTRPAPYPLPQRPTPPSIGSFRGYSGWGPQLGPCFACGQVGHIRRTCPTTRGQQASAQARKY